ncbi:hypothetical protein [Streptomyces sp. 7N604]|uniref:hypothetical protein n=1 Tax=Streptomyces sp. 7N604 TaxID=3457415 RepID=UPI003FD4AC18
MAVGAACTGYLLLLVAALSGVLQQHVEKKPPRTVEPSTTDSDRPGSEPSADLTAPARVVATVSSVPTSTARPAAEPADASPPPTATTAAPATTSLPGHGRTRAALVRANPSPRGGTVR